MKRIVFFVLTLILVYTTACQKVKPARGLPKIKDIYATQVTAAEAIWLERVAAHERDSIRIADSIRAATGAGVDVNSLFHKKNIAIAVVEVNDHYLANVLCYKDKKGKYLFDLAVPFSANINIDSTTGKETVKYNLENQAMLRLNVYRQIKDAGIPIALSLLGNHDRAGFSNFRSLEDATAFAQIVAREVRQKKFDAVFADDEYSVSVSDGHPSSYVMVMSEIKRLLPATFLCYYVYGGGSTPYNGKKMGDVADAAIAPFYPEYPDDSYSSVYGFSKNKWVAASSETAGGFGDPEQTMQNLKNDGLKGIMFYNVSGRSSSPEFYAPYFKELKGAELMVAPGCLNPIEGSFVNGR